MKTEIYHPFEVDVLPILNEGIESLYFSVNSGKVFNFYNPLNYRMATCDRDGPELPKLPFSLRSDFNSIKDKIFPIEGGASKIYVYLFCSFLPPNNWVPGPSFIPFIDKAWIVYKTGTVIKGQINNKERNHIKYRSHKNVGLSDPGYAINYSPIASIEKKENDQWVVNQFLKDDLPITTLFDSSSFELHNTDLYKLSVESDYNGSPSFASMKQQVSEIFDIPTVNTLKGYIRADIKLRPPLVGPKPSPEKIDIENRLGFENIASLIPLSPPESTGPPKIEYPNSTPPPNPYPVPTGVRIYN
jgi:hypothetical protein